MSAFRNHHRRDRFLEFFAHILSQKFRIGSEQHSDSFTAGKHIKKLEKELQAAIYDAEDGSCLFGRVLYVNKSSMYKYDYVIDDHATEAFTACWDLSACWLNK